MAAQPSIHKTLAHSYLAYFIFSIIGLFVDTIVGFSIAVPHAIPVAAGCLLAGLLLIVWAQQTSRRAARTGSVYFNRGPYRYMRNPTHLGIVFLVVGYTLISGSIVFCGVTVVGYIISNILFGKYEAVLDRTYGQEHQSYKRSVPKIF